jgi:hypothetical protein
MATLTRAGTIKFYLYPKDRRARTCPEKEQEKWHQSFLKMHHVFIQAPPSLQ